MKKGKNQRKHSDQNILMPVVHPHAAGIDIGSKSHFVCVAQDNVREFGVCTDDLHTLAGHLKAHQIETVAIESTGFYWQSLFTLLQDYGFEVILVNARQVKNVKGHKTDVVDSKWLQLLHSIGLLSNRFQPDFFTSKLRVYTRHRKYLIESASRYIAKMNKIFVLMNIQLGTVLRDITGASGKRIIEAVLSGERDPKKLAAQASHQVKAKPEDIARALTGDWREEHLFELKQSYELYQHYWQMIQQTDQEIEKLLEQKTADSFPKQKYEPTANKGYNKNDPDIDVGRLAFSMSGGVDLLQITGVGVGTVLTLMSEIGFNLSKFPTAKHFASWLGFTPNRKISGGKELSSKTPPKTSPLVKAIRDAANAVGNSKSRLGDFFRRLAYRRGRAIAVTATGRKLAVIIYHMLTRKEPYSYSFSYADEAQQRSRKLKSVLKIIRREAFTAIDLSPILG